MKVNGDCGCQSVDLDNILFHKKKKKKWVLLKVDMPEENNIPLFPCPLGLWFFVQSVRTVTKTGKKHIMNTCLSGTEQRHNNSA